MYSLKLLLVLFFIQSVRPEKNSTLVLLQIVHRHGDRTPISFYDKDPYKHDKWLDGLGELTPRGKNRLFEFGQRLRVRYGDYLGDSPRNIYLRSSASDRCIESASALATGLYPPVNRWVWSKSAISLFWQPIAVQTVLKSTDGLLVPGADCPAADAAYEEMMRSKEVVQFMDSQKEFIQKIEAKTGQKFTKLRQLDYLYDTIRAEMTFDEPKPAPKWITDLGNDTLDKLKQFEWNAFKFDYSSKKIQRLRAGLILKELTTNMENVVKKVDGLKKVYSYATHDSLLVPVLQALGLYSGIPPSYASALLFELHLINGQHFVHLVYANVTPTLIYKPLELKNCGSVNKTKTNCQLNQFVDSIRQFIPNDWHKECQLNAQNVLYSTELKESDEIHEQNHCSRDVGSIFLLTLGFFFGILFLLTIKLFKTMCDRYLPPNQNRFFKNSYSINTLHKNNDKTLPK